MEKPFNPEAKKDEIKFQLWYSAKSEAQMLTYVKRRAPYYRENGYSASLPAGFTLQNIDALQDSEIPEIVANELEPEKAQEFLSDLKKKWEEEECLILEELKKLPGKVPTDFVIQCTKYGPGGNYFISKDSIGAIIGFNNPHPFQSLIHELIHTMIHYPIVEKFSLNSAEKESITDYLVISSEPLKELTKRCYQAHGPPSEELLERVGLYENINDKFDK